MSNSKSSRKSLTSVTLVPKVVLEKKEKCRNYVPNVMIDRAFKLPLTRKNCQASGETGLKADKEK